MISERKFNIRNIKMPQDMRVCVLDEVRRTIQQNLNDADSTSFLKQKLQLKYGQYWNIIIGNGMDMSFNQKIIKDYIELQTELKKIIIYRRYKPGEKLRNSQDY